MHNYHDTFKVIPPAGTNPIELKGNDASNETAPRIGWQVRILPFTEQVPLYDRLNMAAPQAARGDAPLPKDPTAKVAEHQVPYSMCPDDDSERYLFLRSLNYAQGSYTGNMGSQFVKRTGTKGAGLFLDGASIKEALPL